MKQLLILGMLLLLLTTSVSAELIMDPNPIDIGVKINEPTTFNITMTNTYEFAIKSFEFSNLTGFTFPADLELQPNETKQVLFDVERDQLTSEVITSQVSFKYIVDIPEDPTTHQVELGIYGFDPDYLTILQGDTVVWTNVDDITHSVTGSFFDLDLSPNESGSVVFPNVGQQNYQDLVLFWAGTIQVLERTEDQEVNNPSYNRNLKVNLDVYSDPTNLSINVVDNDFTVNYRGSDEGLLSIKNDGSEIAHKVKLTSNNEWIKFDENNFNLDSGSTNYVIFRIEPLIFETNETNKTYDVQIKAQGLNTGEVIGELSLFIPYENIFIDETDPEYVLRLIEDFCNRNPNNAFCNPPNSTSGEVIVRNPEIPVNLTASEVYAMLKRIQRIEDSNQRTNNKLVSIANLIETEFPQFAFLLNSTYNKAEESEDRRATNEAIFWIVGIFAILIIGFLVTWRYYEKWKHKQYLMGRDG